MKTPPGDWDKYFQRVEAQIEQQCAAVDKKNVALRLAVYILYLQPEPAIVKRSIEIIKEVLKLR